MSETIIRADGLLLHYFGTNKPWLVSFDVEALDWTEIEAPHEEIAAIHFWNAATERPTNQLLVREHGAELAALILIERNGEAAYVTDVEVDDRAQQEATP